MSNPLQVTPTIAADRFPVSILMADNDGAYSVAFPKVRAILTHNADNTGGRLTMWTAPEVVVFDAEWLREGSQFGPKSQDWFVETRMEQVVIRPLGGCGCGDRLKHWTPERFQPYRLGRPLR